MKILSPLYHRLLPLLAFLLLALPAGGAPATDEEYTLSHHRAPEENLLSLIFGSPPPLATQRGILLIDAFADLNGNGRRDPGEADLGGQLSCILDGIDYTVPAFIPGLKYEGSYQLVCQGASFQPALAQHDLFIAQRGEIIRLDLPCRKISESAVPPLLSNDQPKH